MNRWEWYALVGFVWTVLRWVGAAWRAARGGDIKASDWSALVFIFNWALWPSDVLLLLIRIPVAIVKTFAKQ